MDLRILNWHRESIEAKDTLLVYACCYKKKLSLYIRKCEVDTIDTVGK